MKLKAIPLLLLLPALMLLLVACGGGTQTADTLTPEAGIVAEMEVKTSPTNEPPKPVATPMPTATPGPLSEVPSEARWAMVEGSTATYIVREQLAGISFPSDAVGTTEAIEGIVVLGSGNTIHAEQSEITVDLTTLKSDENRRDNYIKRNTLQTDQFPIARFVPLEAKGLPYPLPIEGDAVFQLVGEMTIHGITSPVTWDASVTFAANEVTGQATTSFQFQKFEMKQPRVRSVLSVEDNIRLQIRFKLKRTG